MPRASREGRGLALALACSLSSACGTAHESRKQELLVLAATSLTEAFQQLEREHELKHPTVDVLLSFAASSALALQIDQGGRGDVLATANHVHLDRLAHAGLIEGAAVFAYNDLVVAVAPGNPAKLERFADLPKAGRIVLGASGVPVGRYADALIERASEQLGSGFGEAIHARVVSREANVRLVLAKVELGEADAAIVYRSDIRAPECKPPVPGVPAIAKPCTGARGLPIPDALAERATYPIGVATRSEHPALARAFVEHVLSPEGQAVLAAHGFIPARPTATSAEPKP